MIDESAVPDWPVVLIRMTSDGRTEVDGRPVFPGPGEDARDAALRQAAHTADSLGRPVRVDAHEADGTLFPLVVDAAGTVTEVGPPVPPASERRGLLRRRRTAVPPPSAPTAIHEPPVPDAQFTSETGTPPVRAFAHTPATATDPNLPQPSPHQAAVLDRVRGLAESGDQSAALRLLAELQPDADAAESVALGEVRAYLAFLEGDAVRATRLYTDAALAWLRLRPTADDWALGLTECAHYAWTHIGDSEQVFDLGTELLAAYLALGIADSPRADAARARLDEARTQLL